MKIAHTVRIALAQTSTPHAPAALAQTGQRGRRRPWPAPVDLVRSLHEDAHGDL